jgi:hypothetical protein
MERESLREHLEMSDRHVKRGLEHIAEMEERIVRLADDGHDTMDAKSLLVTLRETQALHEAHRLLVIKQIEEDKRAERIARGIRPA